MSLPPAQATGRAHRAQHAPQTEAVSILWRRLDAPGHDACRLERTDAGWVLDGEAVFRHGKGPTRLAYRIACDAAWATRRGDVRGWLGPRRIALAVHRSVAGAWFLNGRGVRGLDACLDLDLGFTPATNLLQLRRIALAEGETADVPVAWLDVAAGTLEPLAQRYERRSATTYWYEAPRFGYKALLEVDEDGFVRHYPDLWEMEG